jgi:hypothetical protein
VVHLPANTISGHTVLSNGLGQESLVESMHGMWQMGVKACGRPGLERLSGGMAFACQRH